MKRILQLATSVSSGTNSHFNLILLWISKHYLAFFFKEQRWNYLGGHSNHWIVLMFIATTLILPDCFLFPDNGCTLLIAKCLHMNLVEQAKAFQFLPNLLPKIVTFSKLERFCSSSSFCWSVVNKNIKVKELNIVKLIDQIERRNCSGRSRVQECRVLEHSSGRSGP